MRHGLVLAGLAALLGAAPAAAQLDQLLKQFPQLPGTTQIPGSDASSLGDVKIGQALEIGTERAVNLTGKTDGYFRNEAIKILLPERLKSLETGLRMAGFGSQVDELVLGMNRAAERAAPRAKQIFWDAIGAMSIDDARRILGGGDTAATDYFRQTTSEPLAAAFRPIVERSMNEVGAEAYDLDRYVVDKALTGLFVVVGEEERKIRTNPSARVTDLLREVFGGR